MGMNQKNSFLNDLLSIRWGGIDWVEELLYVSLAAMDACLIYPWYVLFNTLAKNEAHVLSLFGMCLLVWVPYLLASLLNRSKLAVDRKQAVVAGLMLITALVTVRINLYGDYGIGKLGWFVAMTDRLFSLLTTLSPDLVVVFLVFIGWWRGIIWSRQDVDMRQVGFHFRLGIILFLGYFIIAIFAKGDNMVGVVFAYFFFGLLSIALARVLEVGGIHDSSLGSKQWVGVLIGSSLGSLGLALLASILFSRQVWQAVLKWVMPLWKLVEKVSWYIVGAILYLFYPLVEWLVALFEELRRNSGVEGEGVFASPLLSPLFDPQTQEPQAWVPYCNTVLMVIVLLLGLLLVARLIRRLAEQREKDGDVERESVWSTQDFADDLKNSLRQGLDNLRALMSRFGDRRHRSAESIRKIYASMVDLATEAGYPRRPAVTPYEHRETLYGAFPGGQEAVDAITEAYVRVHYGEVPDSRAEMRQIVRHWQQVQGLVAVKEEAPKSQ
ncbi:MAG: DUF4129 domain-containing protein [Anaerolineae bacterium]|nr:DUF4129 domain-containing protein [Anaerolineae bacterium]